MLIGAWARRWLERHVRVELEELFGSGDSDSGDGTGDCTAPRTGVTAWAMATWSWVPLPVRLLAWASTVILIGVDMTFQP